MRHYQDASEATKLNEFLHHIVCFFNVDGIARRKPLVNEHVFDVVSRPADVRKRLTHGEAKNELLIPATCTIYRVVSTVADTKSQILVIVVNANPYVVYMR